MGPARECIIEEQDEGSILSDTEDANDTENILRVCGDGFRLSVSPRVHTLQRSVLNKNYHKSCVIKFGFIRA